MSPGLYLQQQQQLGCNEEGVDDINGLDLTLSHMANMPPSSFPRLPATWDHPLPAQWFPPPLELTKQCKKPRIDAGAAIASSINNFNQPNCPRMLRFRGHVQTYKQKFRALEALQEPTECDLAIEEGGGGGGGDGVRLVQLLISCAEAVACRDRAQASALLHELKADALVLILCSSSASKP